MEKNGSGRKITRRQMVAALGVAGTSALAGCGSTSDSDVGAPSDKDVPAPSVDASDRWELTTPDSKPRLLQEGSAAIVDYTAHGHIVRFEDTQLRERIHRATFEQIDRPFAVAFAGRVDIYPSSLSLATGLKSGEIDSAIRGNLTSAMEEFGVQNVQRSGTMDASDTPAGEFMVVEGEYPVQEISIDGVDIPHSDRSQLTFGGGTLPIKGIAGRWKSDGSILAGGGVYPKENFADSQGVEMSEAISMDINVDLSLQPARREAQILEFVNSISL